MKNPALFWLVPFLVFACHPLRAAEQDPEDATRTIFLGAKTEKGGAPSKENVEALVLLTNIGKRDPYGPVVEFVREQGVKEVVSFKDRDIGPAFRKLAKIRPGYVVVVVKPAILDVNFHFDLLEAASRLDDDPFVDFAFGYITGATPEEALAFAEGIAAAKKKKKLPRLIVRFGPVKEPGSGAGKSAHGWAKGFKIQTLQHGEDEEGVAGKLARIKGAGILSAWGHGMPDGVSHGLKGKQIRESGLDIHPALYFSGPCYCGVPTAWFKWAGGGYKRETTPLEESFLLALIRARAAGIFAGLDPDRGETNSHELEYVLYTGDPLGMAAKSTYDDAVVAYRRPRFELPRYKIGGRKPHRDIGDTMISGGACRALFGDPTFRPYRKAGDEPFPVKTKWSKKGLEVTWEGNATISRYWTCVDVYRARGYWTHRVSFRLTVPVEKALKLEGVEVRSVTKDGEELTFLYPTAAVEIWGGEARIHGYLVFPHDAKERALFNGSKYRAEFFFPMRKR